MSKKKYYDEHNNEIRSRPPRPFYKKWWFGVIIVFCVIIGIYILGSKNKVEIDPNNLGAGKKNNKEEVKIKKTEIIETEEEIVEEKKYSYENFKGIYVTFEGEPYNSSIKKGMSDLIVLEDDYYRTFNRWDYDMSSTILEKKIEGNILTLELDSAEDEIWGLHSESGTEQFKLHHDGDKKVLYSVKKDSSFYPMSKQELETYYSQSEIDYARIIMTMRGVPSLDFWEVFSSEYDGDKPIIGVSQMNKGDIIRHTNDDGASTYDDNVGYPEDVTELYLRNKTRQDEISYTYSSIGEGYIKIYPVPLNHAIRTGEEVINQAEKKYIEPFEPFEVADFIGRVEFYYE